MADTSLMAVVSILTLVGTMATGIVLINGGFADAYGQNIDQSALQKFNKEENLTSAIDTSEKRATDIGSGINEGFFQLPSVWDAISTVFTAVDVIPAMAVGAFQGLSLPKWPLDFMVAYPTLIISFLLIAAYLTSKGVVR